MGSSLIACCSDGVSMSFCDSRVWSFCWIAIDAFSGGDPYSNPSPNEIPRPDRCA